jgi:hypothetical protein
MFGLILKQKVLNNVTFCPACLFIDCVFDDVVNSIVSYLYISRLYLSRNFRLFSEEIDKDVKRSSFCVLFEFTPAKEPSSSCEW